MPRNKNTEVVEDTAQVTSVEEAAVQEELVEEPVQDEEIQQEEVAVDEAEEPVEEIEDAADEEPEEAEEPVADEADEEEEEPAEAKPAAPRRPRRNSLAEEFGEEANQITQASRNRRRKMYRDADVFTIDPDAKVEGEGTKTRNDYLQLTESQKHGTVMHGMLMSVGPINADAENSTIVGKIRFGSYTVLIPADHLFVLEASAVRDGDVANAQQYFASLRLGATVEFVVLGVNEGTKTAYASRILAMQKLSHEYFVARGSDGNPRVAAGMTVQGRICYVTKTGIGVDVFGAETFIPASELSWTRTYTLEMDQYDVGSYINVKILEVRGMDVTINKQVYHLIDLSASVKQTTQNPNDAYYDYFNEGDRCIATITQVTENGYFVRLADLRDALCDLTEGNIIPVGSKVQVKVTKKVDEGKRIYASIRHIVKLAD